MVGNATPTPPTNTTNNELTQIHSTVTATQLLLKRLPSFCKIAIVHLYFARSFQKRGTSDRS